MIFYFIFKNTFYMVRKAEHFSLPASQLMHCSLFFSKIVYGGFGKKPSEVDIESYEHYAFGNSNDLRISRMLKVNVSRYKSQLFIIHHLINCFQTGLQWFHVTGKVWLMQSICLLESNLITKPKDFTLSLKRMLNRLKSVELRTINANVVARSLRPEK